MPSPPITTSFFYLSFCPKKVHCSKRKLIFPRVTILVIFDGDTTVHGKEFSKVIPTKCSCCIVLFFLRKKTKFNFYIRNETSARALGVERLEPGGWLQGRVTGKKCGTLGYSTCKTRQNASNRKKREQFEKDRKTMIFLSLDI